MKKTLLTSVFLISLTALFISCNSTKEVQNAPDEYADLEQEKLQAINVEKKENNSSPSKKVSATSNKKKKNFFQELFTFGNADEFLKYDETTVFAKELVGMKEKNAVIIARYDDGMAGFGSYINAAYFYVQFDDVNREVLANAAEKYFSDFENKKLNRKGKHTDRTYGKINYRLNWGTISSSTPNYGFGDGYVGYEFVKNSPYFTISNFPFPNIYYERAGDATTRESPPVKYYFTKAQLRNLLEMISEDKIMENLYKNSEEYIAVPTEVDEY